VKFSNDGNFLAISYNNEYLAQDIVADEKEDEDNPLNSMIHQ
jgi:hypothetical protein